MPYRSLASFFGGTKAPSRPSAEVLALATSAAVSPLDQLAGRSAVQPARETAVVRSSVNDCRTAVAVDGIIPIPAHSAVTEQGCVAPAAAAVVVVDDQDDDDVVDAVLAALLVSTVAEDFSPAFQSAFAHLTHPVAVEAVAVVLAEDEAKPVGVVAGVVGFDAEQTDRPAVANPVAPTVANCVWWTNELAALVALDDAQLAYLDSNDDDDESVDAAATAAITASEAEDRSFAVEIVALDAVRSAENDIKDTHSKPGSTDCVWWAMAAPAVPSSTAASTVEEAAVATPASDSFAFERLARSPSDAFEFDPEGEGEDPFEPSVAVEEPSSSVAAEADVLGLFGLEPLGPQGTVVVEANSVAEDTSAETVVFAADVDADVPKAGRISFHDEAFERLRALALTGRLPSVRKERKRFVRKASPLNPAQVLHLRTVAVAAGKIPKTGSLTEAFATATNASPSATASAHAPLAVKSPSPILASVASFLEDLKLPFGRRVQPTSARGAGVIRPTVVARSFRADTEIPADLAHFGVPRP